MKRTIQYAVILLLATLPKIMQAQSSFVSKMVDHKLGNKIAYTVTSDGEKYRYDFIENGIQGIVIVNPAKNETAILRPEKKYVHYTETSSITSTMNDPVQRVMNYMEQYKKKQLGNEKIAGFTCEKSELYEGDKKRFTIWFSEELNFLLKIVNYLGENIYTEMSDIKLQEVDSSVFEIPEGYTKVDRWMRPIIPEPPTPEQWNTIETNLPVNGEYQKGDLVTFKIPKTTNYSVLLNHRSTEPAKIIRKTFRDGKELPKNEQAPLPYRSQRLTEKEWTQGTFNWKEGDNIVLEIHEGKLYIEISEENK